MGKLEFAFGVLLIILAIAVVMVVLFQEGHEKRMGVITGEGSDTYLSKHRSRSLDRFLERWTKVISIVFFLAVILTNVLAYFHVF